jgi:EAL domain-containing protein (putative c-di-GMP-specific phosphodiesterase class I)/GGDEF domain-containing protein
MSPLSVLRVLFLVGAVLWPVAGLAWRWSGTPPWLVLGAGSAMVGCWVALLCVRSIDRRWCWAAGAVWIVDVAALEWSGHGAGLALAATTLYLPGLLFVALFLEKRALLAYLLAATAASWFAFVPAEGAGVAAVVAAVAALGWSSVAVVTLLLNRAARRRESIDADTGLPNAFGLAEVLAGPLSNGRPVVVAAVALQGIGEAREAMGYHVGTELLRRAVEDMGQVLPSDAVIGRVDTEEVVVVRPLGAASRQDGTSRDLGVAEAGHALADTLSRSIRGGRYVIGGVEVGLRPHVGLASAPSEGIGVPELVRRASLSARRAALDGAPATWWDGDRGALTPDDLRLLSDLGDAGPRGELWLAYQPQVEAGSGRTVAVEALLRWRHPRLGELAPGRFVPLAERTGLLDRVTEWVLGEALDAQGRWRASGVEVGVSVNFSARTLSRPDLPGWVIGELEARRLPPGCLTVEMTETAAANLSRAEDVLGALRAGGVRVSIDDFGTGYTSLAALRTLPLDEIKIDLQFVQRSAVSPADEAIVWAVSGLASRLGLVAVAEGVEDGPTAERMIDAGYDLLQGYHLSVPLPELELLAHLAGLAAGTRDGGQ